MNILGIYNGNNASVTLLSDDKILYAAQEERFNRIKLTRGYPLMAIKDCLERNNLKQDDIDIVSCGAWGYPHKDAVEDFLNTLASYDKKKATDRLFHSLQSDAESKAEFFTISKQCFQNAKIELSDHHYSHACTAFYPSPFDEAYIITADGRGDLQSTVVWKATRKNGIKRIKTFCELKSLGALYGQITGVLGFKPDKHEGKITGLAAYGKETDLAQRLLDLIHFENGNLMISKDFVPFLRYDYRNLKELVHNYPKEDVAFAVQHVLEKNMIEIINYYIPDNSNLCLAGGIFANVSLNQKIRENKKIKNYFIFPEMGDGGSSFGGALSSAVKNGFNYFNFENVYLGPDYDWSHTNLSNFKVKRFPSKFELTNYVSNLIIKNKVIGCFIGRMEYGPRALGSRSILVETTNPSISQIMNKRLNRTEFMPLAPITLEGEAEKMYVNYSKKDINTRFMTTCYYCSDAMKKLSPGVIHINSTARPQVINGSNSNELYYLILNNYYQKTGIPNLVNTSFNNHEEPIVCTPEDALASLNIDNVDCIVTDSMVISK